MAPLSVPGMRACFLSSFEVDREGRVRYVMVGEGDWTSPTLVSTIRSLLGPQPAR